MQVFALLPSVWLILTTGDFGTWANQAWPPVGGGWGVLVKATLILPSLRDQGPSWGVVNQEGLEETQPRLLLRTREGTRLEARVLLVKPQGLPPCCLSFYL